MSRTWLVVSILAMACNLGCDREANHVLVKQWAASDPVFQGEAFEFARFKKATHCAIVARHLNAAKDSGAHSADFGIGDYRFECRRAH